MSEGLYTREVDEFIVTRDWPKGLRFRVGSSIDPDKPPHLMLTFFRDNWLTLTAEEQLHTTAVVKEVMAKLWSDGIPTYVSKMESAFTVEDDD